MHDTPTIKLLAIDIDGTLLDPQGHITPRTVAAVQAAQAAETLVTLATARRYLNTRHIADALGLSIPLIMYDGAVIIQHPQGKIMHIHPLHAVVAQAAVEILVSYGVQPVVHHITDGTEEIWTGPVERDNAWIADYFSSFPGTIKRKPYTTLCTGQSDPLRVVAFAPDDIITRLVPGVSALDCNWNAIKQGNYGYAEMAIMHSHCSKASGLATLAQQVGIPMSEVMALGDNNNDVEMLEAAGWGVAMGQASATVKAIANAVTASNEEDGVALAIERYVLHSRGPL